MPANRSVTGSDEPGCTAVESNKLVTNATFKGIIVVTVTLPTRIRISVLLTTKRTELSLTHFCRCEVLMIVPQHFRFTRLIKCAL